jgi:hypothetical protein
VVLGTALHDNATGRGAFSVTVPALQIGGDIPVQGVTLTPSTSVAHLGNTVVVRIQ